MPGDAGPESNRLFALMEKIGDLRDGLLVVVGLLYILGYVAWSLHALVNNLGLLPALQAQYFVAGIVPAIVILMACAAVGYSVKLARKLQEWVSGRPAVSAILALSVVALPWLSDRIPIVPRWISSAVFYVAILVIIFTVYPPRWSRRFILSFGTTYGLLGVILAMSVVYPAIPQDLGGVRPRCAFLDIFKGRVSKEMLRVLSPTGEEATPSGADAVRTIRVDVFYSGGDSLLVKPHEKVKIVKAEFGLPVAVYEKSTYEVRKDAIAGIEWCG